MKIVTMYSRKRKKNEMSWIFNQFDLNTAIRIIGARNLTTIESVVLSTTEEKVIETYSKMIEHDSQEADSKALVWMQSQIKKHKQNDYLGNGESAYIYFRFNRWN